MSPANCAAIITPSGASMIVAMMDVRVMRMLVGQRFVPVPVHMRLPAVPGLVVRVLAGLVPVVMVSRSLDRGR